MEELKVNSKSIQVNQEVLERRMIEDIKEMDMDNLKMLFEFMYSVTVDDVEGLEGEEVIVSIVEDDMNLSDIF
jgi:chromosomal replication initiation ATPase DnaA